MHMWAKIVTCHISNKPPSHQPLQLSPAVQYKGTLGGEKQNTGPRWLKYIWKKWFHLHIPVNRKTLNSFNQRIPFFSLINSNPWCSTIWCLHVCVDKIPIQSGSYLTSLEWSLRASLVVQSVCNAGDLHSIPGLGRAFGEGNDNPLNYSFLENSMDRGASWVTVHGVTKSQTQLSD